MTQLLNTLVSDELTPEAEALQTQMDAEEQQRQADAREAAARHRDSTGQDAPNSNAAGELANHRQELDALGKEVNEASNALLAFAEPGETLEQVAARGLLASNANLPIFAAAHKAVNAHTQMDLQQRAADQAAADITDQAAANEFTEMKSLRKQELRAAARRIAAEEKISLADGFRIALMEIEVDGVATVLPSFGRATQRLAEKYAAETAAEQDGDA